MTEERNDADPTVARHLGGASHEPSPAFESGLAMMGKCRTRGGRFVGQVGAGDSCGNQEQTMSEYMLSVHPATGAPSEPMTAEQQREGFARIAALEAEMEAAKALVFSARLSQPSDAKVVRRGGGRPKSTDGPFAETKEHLGGFYLIEASDIDAAVEWASRVSDAIGEPIEVRPLAGSRRI
jgi:hypothetical protein